MSENNVPKKLIFNPVMAAPWKIQEKNYENPANNLPCAIRPKRKYVRKVNPVAKTEREAQKNRNIASLMTRFPGLKKYQARAALTMSENKLDKAIILLEVSNCYRKEVHTRIDDLFLKNIHINLKYDVKQQDPSVRNVIYENTIPMEQNDLTFLDVCGDDSDDPSSPRVGVVISKTVDGYRVSPLE
ncbi:uncharacterized protein LOC123007271 [Tribolium madens]|uniref:uncharacterized protein LOC123007271 n=1 Tax=Tribolium madens TaxID=41895 RepID=UPI001CF73A79|nr:uncharacterized protein LOC123007271 [Tribolium madens]